MSSSDINNDFNLETYEKPDCIVLDKDINCNIKQKIKEKFEGIKIIYLPSLNDNEILNSENITYISEPFRLSELGEAFKEIYNEKNRTA